MRYFSSFKGQTIHSKNSLENKAEERLPSLLPAQLPLSEAFLPAHTFWVQTKASPFPPPRGCSAQDRQACSSSCGASTTPAFKKPLGDQPSSVPCLTAPPAYRTGALTPSKPPIPLFSLTGPSATLTSAKKKKDLKKRKQKCLLFFLLFFFFLYFFFFSISRTLQPAASVSAQPNVTPGAQHPPSPYLLPTVLGGQPAAEGGV